MLNIYNQNGEIAERFASLSKIGERFVTWCIDNEKSWDLNIDLVVGFFELSCFFLKLVLREE